MIKVLSLALLVLAASCAYNTGIARKLSYAAAACYATPAEIKAWSCKVCGELPLKNV